MSILNIRIEPITSTIIPLIKYAQFCVKWTDTDLENYAFV